MAIAEGAIKANQLAICTCREHTAKVREVMDVASEEVNITYIFIEVIQYWLNKINPEMLFSFFICDLKTIYKHT